MFHVSRTLKNGPTAALRAVFDDTVGNGTPVSTLLNRTLPMVPRGVWQNIDMIAVTHADDFDVGIWWWYESAELWVLDTSLGGGAPGAGYFHINALDGVVRIPLIKNDTSVCADGLYLEVKPKAGGVANPKIWLQGQQ